ncbi:ABC transporter family protein [Striga asiatica]|uniref:ABC transporter family protein n=1 Tax=Striga asiatica TaxID=4170 RepID=A0A5A7P3P6_STRAF|nr:ABC transporter family protein [Striga asiatica]
MDAKEINPIVPRWIPAAGHDHPADYNSAGDSSFASSDIELALGGTHPGFPFSVGPPDRAESGSRRPDKREVEKNVDVVGPLRNGGVYLTWKDLWVTVPEKGAEGRRPILAAATGYAAAGEALAIMGPSGSGKSTLLDALAVWVLISMVSLSCQR